MYGLKMTEVPNLWNFKNTGIELQKFMAIC